VLYHLTIRAWYPEWDSNPHDSPFERDASYQLGYRGILLGVQRSINITMLTYCVPLNLNLPIVADSFDVAKLQQQYHTKISVTEAINPQVIDLFNNLAVRIHAAESFYSPPGFCGRAHVDSFGGDYVKVNWVSGGAGCQMLWYSTTSSIVKDAAITSIGTQAVVYAADQIALQYQTELHSPSIVQVGVPHHIINQNQARLCISLIIKQQNQRIAMAQAQAIFANYIGLRGRI
jgi:hypothetical protein